MTTPLASPPWQKAVTVLSGTLVALTLTGVLYWARAVLIPLALAIFLAFVLSPVVRYFCRHGIPRGPAVLLTVVGAVALAAGTGWVIAQQLTTLTLTLPDHRDRILQKVATLKNWLVGGQTDRLGQLFDEVGVALGSKPPAAPADGPTPVVVEPQTSRWTAWMDRLVNPFVEVLGQGAFAFILVIFLLFKKEDLRDRLIRLVGDGRVTTTTKALNDASARVSRYLLKQFLFNVCFGSAIALGLYLLGVKFALLWGFLAAVMRYIPYLGTWIGVILPTIYTLAVTEVWWQPIGVLVLVLGLEIVCNHFIEPFFYGASLGVSVVAQLVAAGFWSFLWGPIGLVLSGPLTTCLLVLGKHVPMLKFLDVLLGADPPLERGMMLYQRLTARDEDEAARVLQAASKTEGRNEAFDRVVIPALRLTKAAFVAGQISANALAECLTLAGELVDDLPVEERSAVDSGIQIRVLVVPAKDEIDGFACELFARTLSAEKWAVTVTNVATLTGELADSIPDTDPAVVVVGSVPPGGIAHTRYLCKRLLARFPELKLVVGRWGQEEDVEKVTSDFAAVGAESVSVSLAATRLHLATWLPVLNAQSEKAQPVSNRVPADSRVPVAAALPG